MYLWNNINMLKFLHFYIFTFTFLHFNMLKFTYYIDILELEDNHDNFIMSFLLQKRLRKINNEAVTLHSDLYDILFHKLFY